MGKQFSRVFLKSLMLHPKLNIKTSPGPLVAWKIRTHVPMQGHGFNSCLGGSHKPGLCRRNLCWEKPSIATRRSPTHIKREACTVKQGPVGPNKRGLPGLKKTSVANKFLLWMMHFHHRSRSAQKSGGCSLKRWRALHGRDVTPQEPARSPCP